MLWMRRFAFALTLLACCGASAADHEIPGTTRENVVFGTSALDDGSTIDRVMDVHRPHADASGPSPAIVFIHGNPGDKPYPGDRQHGWRDFAAYFVGKGYICFVPAWDLRQGHENAFPQIELAVRHIREHAAEYGVDADCIVAIGHSYGARHACTLATADRIDPQARVAAAVMLAGGMSYPDDCDPHDAPVILFYGTADTWFPQADGILQNLQRGNVPHAYVEIKDNGHGIARDLKLDNGHTVAETIEAFLGVHMLANDRAFCALRVVIEGEGTIDWRDGPSHGLYARDTPVAFRVAPAEGSKVATVEGADMVAGNDVTVKLDRNREVRVVIDAGE